MTDNEEAEAPVGIQGRILLRMEEQPQTAGRTVPSRNEHVGMEQVESAQPQLHPAVGV